MNTKTPVTIPDDRVYCLLSSAVYAIAYWVERFDWTPGRVPHPDPSIGGCEAAPLCPGGKWTITPADAPHCCDAMVLDRDAITRGLAAMAQIYPTHFADLLTENDDAITADVFVQCCLFGEIVYG